MEKTKKYFKDISKSVLIGCILATVVAVILFLLRYLIISRNIGDVVNFVGSILLTIGAFGLLLSGSFIIRHESRRPLQYDKSWKMHFQILQFDKVILIINIMFIFLGTIIDKITFSV